MKFIHAVFSRFIAAFPRLSDWIFAVMARPCAYVFKGYRRVGPQYLKVTTQLLRDKGIYPIRDHYYDPLFNDRHLKRPLSEDRVLPGIAFEEQRQVELLSQLKYAKELIEMKLEKPSGVSGEFYIDNGNYERGDAEFLYQFIRHIRPRRIIEIGSGNSTKIARLAIKRNDVELNRNTHHVCIEPYEMPFLEELGFEVIRKTVEDCDLEMFSSLEAGDLLFIDSSHIIRPQGDVLFEYQQILPRLNSGVYVHIHDVFTPKDYPHAWVVEEIRLWNEQYLVEVMLANPSRYQIVAMLNYLKHRQYDLLQKACLYLKKDTEPSALYLQIK